MARASNRSQEQLQWDEEIEDGKHVGTVCVLLNSRL